MRHEDLEENAMLFQIPNEKADAMIMDHGHQPACVLANVLNLIETLIRMFLQDK
jgi:hypothetical protein